MLQCAFSCCTVCHASSVACAEQTSSMCFRQSELSIGQTVVPFQLEKMPAHAFLHHRTAGRKTLSQGMNCQAVAGLLLHHHKLSHCILTAIVDDASSGIASKLHMPDERKFFLRVYGNSWCCTSFAHTSGRTRYAPTGRMAICSVACETSRQEVLDEKKCLCEKISSVREVPL